MNNIGITVLFKEEDDKEDVLDFVSNIQCKLNLKRKEQVYYRALEFYWNHIKNT